MLVTVEFTSGPLDGEKLRIDLGVALAPPWPSIAAPVNCVDDEVREFEYQIDRLPNGLFVGVPHPEFDNNWFIWGCWCAWLRDGGLYARWDGNGDASS